MKNEKKIKTALIEELERAAPESEIPMELEEWGYSHGWIEALRWVLNDYSTEIDDTKKDLTEGANNDTIRRALKRLSEDCGFGRKDDVVNSKVNSIHNDRIRIEEQCFT